MNETTTAPSILGTMPYEKAKAIMHTVLDVAIEAQGIGCKGAVFPMEYSLEEICIAARLVGKHKGHPNADGTRTMMLTIADRGIAAHYALAHYNNNPEALLEALGFCVSSEDDEF
ncbi:MAG: hypothetical protein ACRC62_03645 [Microcoleus sp.]